MQQLARPRAVGHRRALEELDQAAGLGAALRSRAVEHDPAAVQFEGRLQLRRRKGGRRPDGQPVVRRGECRRPRRRSSPSSGSGSAIEQAALGACRRAAWPTSRGGLVRPDLREPDEPDEQHAQRVLPEELAAGESDVGEQLQGQRRRRTDLGERAEHPPIAGHQLGPRLADSSVGNLRGVGFQLDGEHGRVRRPRSPRPRRRPGRRAAQGRRARGTRRWRTGRGR